MQRLLSLKLLSKVPRNSSSNNKECLLQFHPFKTFCGTNPTNLTLGSSLKSPGFISSPPWQSSTSSFVKFSGFASYQKAVNQFLFSTHLKSRGRNLSDLWIQFHGRNSDVYSSFRSYHRGWRSWFQMPTAENAVWGLIITNVGVFLLWRVANHQFMLKNFAISLDNFTSGRVHTIITSAFSHFELGDLISHLLGVYFFGMSVAREFGPEFLIKLYLAGALAGSLCYLVYNVFIAASTKGQQMWYQDLSRTPGSGASGAVNAIVLLYIYLFPKSTIYLELFIPVPAIVLGILLIGHDMWRINQGDKSHISGLGGAIAAAVVWSRLRRGRF